jgi:hypothetical protein
MERLFAESEEALRRAAALAGTSILYRRADALVNLAWLGFFAGQDDLVEAATGEAEQVIPPEYRISPASGEPSILAEQAEILLWPQLGKLHMLYGHRAFERYSVSGTSPGAGRAESLVEAVDHYLWGLEYNALYSRDSPGLRRAKDEVYEKLKEADFDGLRMIANKVQQLEQAFHLGESVIRQLLQHRALWYG